VPNYRKPEEGARTQIIRVSVHSISHSTNQQQTHVHAKHQYKRIPPHKHAQTKKNAHAKPNNNIKINTTHKLAHAT
jgi:hypothetical protein